MWSLIFYGLGLVIAFILFFVSISLYPFQGELCTTSVIIWIISPIVGYLIGLKKEKEGGIKPENKRLDEIKQLLIEHKSLTEIEEKIQSWKKEGYDVSELQKMIEDTKGIK